MKLLVTGGAGFIGSNFIRYWLGKYSEDSIVNLDKLTYAGNLRSLNDVEKAFNARYKFIQEDITNFDFVDKIFIEHKPEIVVNFAAESHNSWAIIDPGKFFRTNTLGTQTLLEVSRRREIKRFQHISTCEVYGDLSLDSKESFTESSPLKPRTPYNASKAGADHAVQAYFHTFGLPTLISRCSNNYGSYQFPEKIIPLFATNALEEKPLTLYKHSSNKREWIHVLDHCRAIDLMIHKGKEGEVYNIGSGIEKTIEEIADFILETLGFSQSMKTYVSDRPSHDRRYLLDSSKIKNELGWQPTTNFEDGLRETIEWYARNREWWIPLKEKNILQESNWSK